MGQYVGWDKGGADKRDVGGTDLCLVFHARTRLTDEERRFIASTTRGCVNYVGL